MSGGGSRVSVTTSRIIPGRAISIRFIRNIQVTVVFDLGKVLITRGQSSTPGSYQPSVRMSPAVVQRIRGYICHDRTYKNYQNSHFMEGGESMKLSRHHLRALVLICVFAFTLSVSFAFTANADEAYLCCVKPPDEYCGICNGWMMDWWALEDCQCKEPPPWVYCPWTYPECY